MTFVKNQGRTMSLLLFSWLALSCKSEAEKKCEQLIKSSEVSLLSMNPTDQGSVEQTLGELRATHETCKAAKSPEVSEIEVSIKNVERHLQRLESGEVKPPPPPPGREQLAALEKNGDPGCPMGQGYMHPILKKQIKCSGPLMVEQTYAQVIEYFKKHRIAAAVKDNMVRGTQAQVTFTFVFDRMESTEGAKCLTLDAPMEKKPSELVSFATNILVDQIDVTKPLEVRGRTLPLSVEKKDGKHTIVIGDCGAEVPMIPREDAPGEDAPGEDGDAANESEAAE